MHQLKNYFQIEHISLKFEYYRKLRAPLIARFPRISVIVQWPGTSATERADLLKVSLVVHHIVNKLKGRDETEIVCTLEWNSSLSVARFF